jgi:Mn2+/Fe2+ NRAMP family transporter
VLLWLQSVLVLNDGIHHRPDLRVDAVTLSILAFTIVAQVIAAILCGAVASGGGQNATSVDAVAQDHRNDGEPLPRPRRLTTVVRMS